MRHYDLDDLLACHDNGFSVDEHRIDYDIDEPSKPEDFDNMKKEHRIKDAKDAVNTLIEELFMVADNIDEDRIKTALRVLCDVHFGDNDDQDLKKNINVVHEDKYYKLHRRLKELEDMKWKK